MNKSLRKIFAFIAPLIVVIPVAFAFSGLRAQRICDEIMRSEFAPPPRYKTQFALNPGRYMDGIQGNHGPAWVVTYVSKRGEYGTAFCVNLFGKIVATGTPEMVKARHTAEEIKLERFNVGIAKLDAAIKVGDTYSNIISILGKPISISTNGEEAFIADFLCDSPTIQSTHVTTNGFTLEFSNGILTRKDYIYGF